MDTKKDYNQKHECTITSTLKPIFDGEKPDHGKIIPHKVIAESVSFYRPIDNYRYINVFISAQMILDLAEQIKQINASEIDHYYDEYPF